MFNTNNVMLASYFYFYCNCMQWLQRRSRGLMLVVLARNVWMFHNHKWHPILIFHILLEMTFSVQFCVSLKIYIAV